MEKELDYAEMLEIPVSTVNVVKKKSLFKRKPAKESAPKDDLKDTVIDSVNERVGAYVYPEDLSDPPAPVKAASNKRDKGSVVIFCELAAICLIAMAIFLTNVFMPNSVINTFIGSLSSDNKEIVEPTYSECELSPVISELSDAEVKASENGVLSFTSKGSVYPVYKGKVSSIKKDGELYTVQIAHTSTFKSVITGLTDVYSAEGTQVAANIPFAYSNGEHEVQVSMYDGENLLNCYSLSGEVPVWNS